jgi:hypothetical protein
LNFTISIINFDSTNIHERIINVYYDPALIMINPKRTYTVWTNRIVIITGTNLDKFVSGVGDYKMSVSSSSCAVFFLNSTQLQCWLPTGAPIPDDGNNEYCLVRLKVGNYLVQLGKILYNIPVFTDKPDGPSTVYLYRYDDYVITINGTNLMAFITSGDIYMIQIGQGECTNITLTSTEIKCLPPKIKPAVLGGYTQRNDEPQIVVTVPRIASSAAYQYTTHVGYVFYSDRIIAQTTTPTTTRADDSDTVTRHVNRGPWDESWPWALIGLALAVGALSLFCFLCCWCCMPYLRRDKKSQSETEYPETLSRQSSFRGYNNKLSSTVESDGRRLYYIHDEIVPRDNGRY